jgi:hypothetical protein
VAVRYGAAQYCTVSTVGRRREKGGRLLTAQHPGAQAWFCQLKVGPSAAVVPILAVAPLFYLSFWNGKPRPSFEDPSLVPFLCSLVKGLAENGAVRQAKRRPGVRFQVPKQSSFTWPVMTWGLDTGHSQIRPRACFPFIPRMHHAFESDIFDVLYYCIFNVSPGTRSCRRNNAAENLVVGCSIRDGRG